jgi:integrase
MVKKLPVAISEDEFIELIKHTKKENHKVAFLLGFGSGLRVSEILNLQPRNINLKEKKILVEQGKGSKDRNVPVPKGFKESHLKLFPMKFKNIKSGSRSLEKAFKSTCERAGLLKIKPTLHFHSLRHGFASNAVNNGIPIHHVRTLMGHSNISTTNVYLEMNPKEALKSYEELF